MRKFNILNLLHPASFFVSFYAVFFLVGVAIISTYGDFLNCYLSTQTFIIIFLYLIVFIISSSFSPIFLHRPRPTSPITTIEVSGWKPISLTFWIFGLIFLLLFYIKAGTIVALEENVEDLRVTTKAGIGKYIVIGNAFFTVSLCFLHALLVKVNVKKLFKYLIYILTFLSFLLLLGTGYRSPFAYMAVSIILTRYFVSEKYEVFKKLSFKFVIFGLLFFAFLLLLGYLRHEEKFAISVIVFLWGFLVQVLNLNTIVEAFPSQFAFLYGASFINDFLVSFPGSDRVFLGVYLKELLSLSFKGEGMTVTAPGEGYINFGISGVIYHALLLGLFCGFIYERYCIKRDLGSRVILFLFSINIAKIVTSGIMPAVLFSIAPQLTLAYLFLFIVRHYSTFHKVRQL